MNNLIHGRGFDSRRLHQPTSKNISKLLKICFQKSTFLLSVDCPWKKSKFIHERRVKVKGRIFTSFVGAVCLLSLIACVSQRLAPLTSFPAYQNASPENQDRIRRGALGAGTSILECRAAWPNSHFEFINAFNVGSSRYETWRVEAPSRANPNVPIWLYIETRDGIAEDFSETRKR